MASVKFRKNDVLFLAGLGVLVVLAIIFFSSMNNNQGGSPQVAGISDEVTFDANGKQLIQIKAKGGYNPRTVNAKANVPSTLRMETAETYGCESSFTIPKMNIRENLPVTGNTDIELTAQAPGTSLVGTCSMGMYSFVINFN